MVLRLAQENAWGYTRILGELKKLGVRKISRSTVIAILKEHGLEPGPRRGEGTWDDFLKRHAATLWSCDFFSKKVWTMTGLVEVFVLFFIHLGSRRVHIAGMTANPERSWMVQQARNIAMIFDQEMVKPKYLLRDRDGKFVQEFDALLASEGIEVKRLGVRAPNQNAIAERFVQSVRRGCRDHFVVFGEAHLRHILSEYVTYYLQFRPHRVWITVRWVGQSQLRKRQIDRWLRLSVRSVWAACCVTISEAQRKVTRRLGVWPTFAVRAGWRFHADQDRQGDARPFFGRQKVPVKRQTVCAKRDGTP